ncbi:head maturation protease, ClpP-related [Actinoplanes awajinensis]|uniref:ATP-dependent Clp protease proteolytic subunit n=1 Tax=Actinoplanes awajinensis subsp. mycoplanecinus TaxID=135947 RepID=A0A101J8T4_9ACTN|nr:head maturation protease, ClpP-related [Actinoplanes awajinensis]KUL22350.1 hypothetical protein ADL15_48320 [Actinoplanes awajinensis subsp. mycoplanecinus]
MRHLPSNLAALRASWRAVNGVANHDTPCFTVTNAAVPKLTVFGMIGGLDNDATDFVRTVHALDAKAMDVHINSPGGFAWDAMAMYEALRSHPAKVAVKIDGLAGSAASFLAQAGDTVDIMTGGRMMIHDAAVVAEGNPAELREIADMVDMLSDDIADIYTARAGGSRATWRKAMTATTWYSAAEAVAAKLADRVTGGRDTKTSGPDNRSRLITARVRALTTREG